MPINWHRGVCESLHEPVRDLAHCLLDYKWGKLGSVGQDRVGAEFVLVARWRQSKQGKRHGAGSDKIEAVRRGAGEVFRKLAGRKGTRQAQSRERVSVYWHFGLPRKVRKPIDRVAAQCWFEEMNHGFLTCGTFALVNSFARSAQPGHPILTHDSVKPLDTGERDFGKGWSEEKISRRRTVFGRGFHSRLGSVGWRRKWKLVAMRLTP